MLITRPKVAELAFRLYGRSLHPELFEIFQSRVIERGGYTAKIDITSDGHLVTWRYQGLTLTEVACAARHPLPQKRRLFSYHLQGQRNDEVKCRGGIKYGVNVHLDPVDPDVFWTFQQELAGGETQGMYQRFDADGRLAVGAMSYIHVESRNRTLKIRAIHTYPDTYAIVKSQSQFELP